jgi:hypothetical protein
MWDLFDVLIHAWRSRLPPYDKVVQVPSRLPGTLIRGSLAHARWLFNACYYMRGKINSATALIKLSHLYEVQPWMFDPSQFTEAEGARIEVLEALNSGGLGFNAEETSRFWVENFQKLHRFWDGNPINFYEKSDSYEDLCKILIAQKKSKDNPNGFFAFRHKMVSMLSYFFAKAGIINPLKHPPPIDFHWCRVMVATEAVKMKNMGPGTRFNFEELGAVIRPLTLEYCKDASAILDLADAVWHLSRSFCSMDHGNSSHQGAYNARRTAITPKARIWTASAERRFHRTCGQCMLKDVCKWNIPSAHNYIEGKIVVRGARLKPLDLFVD